MTARPIWPLVPGDWKPLDDDESAAFAERLAEALQQIQGDGAFTKRHAVSGLRATPLSFYPGWLLVEGDVQVSADEIGTFDVLYGPASMCLLDGTSGVVHELNPGTLAPLDAQTTGPDYLRFFCAAVWGEEGPFRLIERADAPELADMPLDDITWQARARPLALDKAEHGLEGEALVCYGESLFGARFRLLDNGMVQMLDDEPVATGVPVRRHRAPLRDLREPRS